MLLHNDPDHAARPKRSTTTLLAAGLATLGIGAAGVGLGLALDDAPARDTATPAAAMTKLYGPDPALMEGADHAEDAHAATAATPVQRYEWPDPTLPAVPAGKVKRFAVDVAERVTRVADDKPPLRVWSYVVNGHMMKGTGGSPPMVVNQGDTVEIAFTNGSSKAMEVHFPHSIDLHSSEISPQKAYKDVEPGQTHRFRFVAEQPGVFMYHCGTKPVLRHVGAGMAGMMVVKPRDLPKVDRELWLTQQEYYLGRPKEDASVEKMVAKTPDVIAFNGYASQYVKKPIEVRRNERLRIWVLNAGINTPSSFHVIGSIFDRVWTEGDTRKAAQTMNLGPAEGGYVELTLDDEGTFPFVNHAFGDMVRGAGGALRTSGAAAEPANAPTPAPHDDAAGAEHGHGG